MSLSPATLLTIYCVAILLASLAGGWIPMLIRLTHRRMQFAVSFVSGVMLGIALLDLLPHAWHEHALAKPDQVGAHGSNGVMLWMLGGFLAMFILERFFCFHHHDVDEQGHAGCSHHDHQPGEPGPAGHELSWTGAMVGLTIHSLIAGIALAASVFAGHDHAHHHHGHDHAHDDPAVWVGIGTFLVIFLHKPFDSLTLGTLMAASGQPRRRRHLVNAAFALTIPLGAIAFAFGIEMDGTMRHAALSAALAFSAGTFLCISLADLLPELQFHSHDRVGLTVALLLGLAAAFGMTLLEAVSHGP